MKSKIIWGVVILTLVILIGVAIGQSNTEVRTRNLFGAKISERTAFFDRMWKIISQKAQVAEKNKDAGIQAIQAAMSARHVDSGAQRLMTFVVEANPNIDPRERQELYKELSRTIESERIGFFEQEKQLQDIKLQHDNLIGQFPGSILFTILGREPLDYKPITSDRTEDAIKTGKDNNVNVF